LRATRQFQARISAGERVNSAEIVRSTPEDWDFAPATVKPWQ
jgi:hypothetical protein